jgi:FKBP-type peptidyl-prolyl cis-trans isomerase (trigger factor)
MEDYVVVSYEGTVDGKPVHESFPKAGKPLSGNDEFWIKMTDEAFFPGYCAQLVGANPGETREFDIELPANMVRGETQRILGELVRENQARGVAEEVLKENQKELVGVASQNAREKLKGTFLLLRIAEAEDLAVSREEIFGRIAALAERYKVTFEKMVKELQKSNGIDQLTEEILTVKALDFVVSKANVAALSEGK